MFFLKMDQENGSCGTIYIYIYNVETTSIMAPTDIEITFTTLVLVKTFFTLVLVKTDVEASHY